MDLTLVPFGYSESHDRLFDVYQVDSGKRCGCVCPSCRAPLIARRGRKKIWHFAHDSKSELFNKLEKCSYSFFVSARMMARQLIGDSLLIKLPKCEIVLTERIPNSDRYVEISETVTASRQVRLQGVAVDGHVGGCSVDLLGNVDGYLLAIVFAYPGREDFGRFAGLNDSKTGVVVISFDSLKERLLMANAQGRTYSDMLADFISNDVQSKAWIYHPRYPHSEHTAKSRLSNELTNATLKFKQKTSKTRRRTLFDDELLDALKKSQHTSGSGTRYRFTCRLCNSSWTGTGHVAATCKKCRSSLLVSRSEVLDCDS